MANSIAVVRSEMITRSTVVAGLWLRTAFVGGSVAAIALLEAFGGTMSAAGALVAACGGAGLTFVAWRRAQRALDATDWRDGSAEDVARTRMAGPAPRRPTPETA